MRARNSARIGGCTEHRRSSWEDNGKGSLETSNQSFGKEPKDREEESVQREEREERTEFIGFFHGVLGGEIKRWRIRQDRESNSRVRRTSKADRQK
jgi:hypothetical protein